MKPPDIILASSPCLAGACDEDVQQAHDVAVWRRAARQRLLAERAALPLATRAAAAAGIIAVLDAVLRARFGGVQGLTISAWWPIKAELDLRPWLRALAARVAQAALPVVETRAAPLVFRPWAEGARMERGFWNILVPAEGPAVIPDVTLAPVVGWDAAGFRLGYGGGYFDRTLAALQPKPCAIGIGLQAARVPTIFPQGHDIAMDMIVTEAGLQA